MPSDYYGQRVDFEALAKAESLWREQGQAMTVAAETIADSTTRGFDQDVRGAVRDFLTTWSDFTSGLAKEAEGTADSLGEGLRAYIENDSQAEQEFHRLYGVLE